MLTNEKKLNVIYTPAGAAREYAACALNLYNGCTHGCRYCYAKRFNPTAYADAARPKRNVLDLLRRDLDRLAGTDVPEICLSFQGDVYQPAEMDLGLTWQAVTLLREHGRAFTVLTKGGTRALRDFDLFQVFPARFGTSLVWTRQADADLWEPGAAPIQDRFNALAEAHIRQIPTWISLEPVIDPAQAIQLVKDLHPLVNLWRIGKINHAAALERAHDWRAFRAEMQATLEAVGATYHFKRSLTFE